MYSVSEMAEDLLPKLNPVLRELESMEKKFEKLDTLGSYEENLDAKIKEINMKIKRFEATKALVNELNKGMTNLNSVVESLTLIEHKEDIDVLRKDNLYMGVYRRDKMYDLLVFVRTKNRITRKRC